MRPARFPHQTEEGEAQAAHKRVGRGDHPIDARVVSFRFEQAVVFLRTGGVANGIVSGGASPKSARVGKRGEQENDGEDGFERSHGRCPHQHSSLALSRRIEPVEHEVHDHAGDGNVEPDRQSDPSNPAMGSEPTGQAQASRDQRERGNDSGQHGMR